MKILIIIVWGKGNLKFKNIKFLFEPIYIPKYVTSFYNL